MRCALLYLRGSGGSGGNGTANNGGPASDAGADVAVNNGTPEDAGPDSSTTVPDGHYDPATPEGVTVEGLSAPVMVRFDAQGVLHVQCETAADCFAVQGYYHAAHRFIQMDVQRRFATGRLSALIGNAALSIDIGMRGLMSTSNGQPMEAAAWEAADPGTREAISAYTRGVNTWLDDVRARRNGARLSEEYQLELLNPGLVDWTETDSIACGMLLLEQLSNTAGQDLSRGAEFPKLPAPQAFDLLGTMAGVERATMLDAGETYQRVQALLRRPDARRMQPALDRLQSYQNLLTHASKSVAEMDTALGKQPDRGSNNWVIGGDLTTSGMPILANDPHLGLQNPALWYLVELHATGADESVHVAGASLPGLPSIMLGHNENIAWGATVVYFDLADAYLEELTPDGSGVVFNGAPVEIIEVEHEFEVARSNPVTRTLRFVPHHGPVLAYDAAAGQAISIRWTANEAASDLNMFFGLMTASNIDEARAAISNSASTNQNWIVADRNGEIGWFPFNAVPERPWASLEMPPWLPLPGDGTAEWGPTIPIDDQPQMRNPSNGFVATANQDPLGTSFDGDPTNEPYGYLYSYGDLTGVRQDAIIKRIEAAGDQHTAQISMDMQGDSFLVMRDLVLPHVQNVVDANPTALGSDAAAVWAAVENWDGTCPTGVEGSDPMGPMATEGAAASIGCTAFHYLLFALSESVFADELSSTSVDHDSLAVLRTLIILLNEPSRLQVPDGYWDNTLTDGPDETREDIVRGAGARRGADHDRLQREPRRLAVGARPHARDVREPVR